MAMKFKIGHKFDIIDLFTITQSEVVELFFRELEEETPDLENVQTFLDSGLVDLNNSFDDEGYGVLHICVIKNYKELIIPFIEAGADVNLFCQRIGDEGTPLHYTASYQAGEGRIEIAKILLDNGADLTIKNGDESTPLNWAENNSYRNNTYDDILKFFKKMKKKPKK